MKNDSKQRTVALGIVAAVREIKTAILRTRYMAARLANAEMLKLYCDEDYSLTEIAQQYSVSRQSVYDTLNRAMLSLSSTEEKLHWASASENRQKVLRKLCDQVRALPVEPSGRTAQAEILEDLQGLLSEEEHYGV